MPKKFKGENSKAAEARARKDAKKQEEDEKKQREKEDALWRDDDKHVAKKMQRKDDKESKRLEALQRKAEREALLAQEMASSSKPTAPTAPKLTQAEISAQKAKQEEERRKELEKMEQEKSKVTVLDDVEENVNRLKIDGEQARDVDSAIRVLTNKEVTLDEHPEKRMKAAYRAYEEKRMPQLKVENPTLRMSQLRQLLKKEWQNSPENPLVQRILGQT